MCNIQKGTVDRLHKLPNVVIEEICSETVIGLSSLTALPVV